ncbi:MAG: hypothetical protein WBW61_11480 [Rhodanobacteraceae bacterium]
MTEHAVVMSVDDSGQRILVKAPWGYTVAFVRAGNVAAGFEFDGIRHDLGTQQWCNRANGEMLDVEVLMPPAEQAVAEKEFIGN